MSRRKMRFCRLCGRPCWGRTCMVCYRKDTHRNLYRTYASRRRKKMYSRGTE